MEDNYCALYHMIAMNEKQKQRNYKGRLQAA